MDRSKGKERCGHTQIPTETEKDADQDGHWPQNSCTDLSTTFEVHEWQNWTTKGKLEKNRSVMGFSVN